MHARWYIFQFVFVSTVAISISWSCDSNGNQCHIQDKWRQIYGCSLNFTWTIHIIQFHVFYEVVRKAFRNEITNENKTQKKKKIDRKPKVKQREWVKERGRMRQKIEIQQLQSTDETIWNRAISTTVGGKETKQKKIVCKFKWREKRRALRNHKYSAVHWKWKHNNSILLVRCNQTAQINFGSFIYFIFVIRCDSIFQWKRIHFVIYSRPTSDLNKLPPSANANAARWRRLQRPNKRTRKKILDTPK